MKKGYLIGLLFLCFGACKERRATLENHKEQESMTDELHLSEQQIQLGNITTGQPEIRTLGEELLLNARVSLNQELSLVVSSRVMGRIEKLYFKNTGESISKGQALYRVYSEELSLMIRDLLLALEKKKVAAGPLIDFDAIIAGARRKLELSGLMAEQIEEIVKSNSFPDAIDILSPASGVIVSVDIKEGSYVMSGTDLFHLNTLSSVWAEAQVYQADMLKISEGSPALISFPSLPGTVHNEKIFFLSPQMDPATTLNTIRIELMNKDGRLVPGMQACVSVLLNNNRALSLPTDAILLDAAGATVWIKTGHNRFKSVMIKTGMESRGYTEITDGLSADDTVVITGAYLIQSEFILKKGSTPMEGHGHEGHH